MKKIFVVLLTLLMLTACGTTTKNEDELVVGMECDYAPYNWTTNVENEYTVAISEVDFADGYDVVLASKIAEKLGKKLVIKKIIWDNLITAVNTGEIDLIIAGMTDNEERRKSVDFTTPYYESDMVVIVKKESELTNIDDIQDLSGYRVMGQINTNYDIVIDQIEGVIHMTPQEAYPRMVLSILQDEADALTAELPVAETVIANNPELTYVKFEKGKGFDIDTSISIALKKDSEIKDAVQNALDSISQDERNQIMKDAMERQR